MNHQPLDTFAGPVLRGAPRTACSEGQDGAMHLHLPAIVGVEHVAAMLDAGARQEALAVLHLLQAAVTAQCTPQASHLFTALRAWEGAIAGMSMAEDLLEEGTEVEELMRWWAQEHQARRDAITAAAS